MRKRGPFWSSFLMQKMQKMALCQVVNGAQITAKSVWRIYQKMDKTRKIMCFVAVSPVDNLVESVNNFLAKGKK